MRKNLYLKELKTFKKRSKKSDHIISGMFYSLWFFIILYVVLMLFSINGHCASEQDYFPMFQNHNGKFTEEMKTAIGNRFDSENNYIFVKWYQYQYNRNYCYVLWLPKDSSFKIYGEKSSNLYEFSLYAVGIFPTNNIRMIEIPNNASYINEYTGFNLSVFSGQSSNYSSNVDYVSNFQIMTNNSSSAQVVLFYDDGVTIPDGDTARDDMEKPDIDDYIPSWNNRPSFDGSSVENALSSIWDITIWTAENTRDTIKGVGQFIGDTLRWTSQKIIDSIRSKIDEIKTGIVNAINNVSAFVQDIKGFVSDIKGFVSYVAEPLDVSSVQNTITGSTAYGDVSTITGAFADFKGVFDSTSEPTEYKIPIHLENIPILNQTQAQYFDLSVISNQRGLIRAFCWVVTTFSLFVTVIDALPNYLKGGDE